MKKFEEKVAIVCGASKGIGLATAVAFAKEGAKVSLIGRNAARLAEAAKNCNDVGAEALELVGDISSLEFLDEIVTKTIERFGRIDVLVNNAAAASMGPLELFNPDDFDRLFHISVRAPLCLSIKSLPHLKTSKGCVINVSGMTGTIPMVGAGVLGMTKAALDHFARCLAAESASSGVRVNNICPAFISGFWEAGFLPQEAMDQLREKQEKSQPFGFLEHEDVVQAILFLATSDKITGTILPVDGGLLVSRG